MEELYRFRDRDRTRCDFNSVKIHSSGYMGRCHYDRRSACIAGRFRCYVWVRHPGSYGDKDSGGVRVPFSCSFQQDTQRKC